MRYLIIYLFLFPFIGHSQHTTFEVDNALKSYINSIEENEEPSQAIGSVSNGSLLNGKLMPYKGNNFVYFDKESYLEGRAFVHSSVRKAVLGMYDSLYKILPYRGFVLMECSNQHGGEMFPHRTHRNGLSIDFMMPLIKNGNPYYNLDTLGAMHYFLDFDDEGRYMDDKEVQIDFNLVARQLLILDVFASRHFGMKIEKVIIKIELKDELFATEYGKILQESGIYVVRNLTTLINDLHDDHFHVDFGPVK